MANRNDKEQLYEGNFTISANKGGYIYHIKDKKLSVDRNFLNLIVPNNEQDFFSNISIQEALEKKDPFTIEFKEKDKYFRLTGKKNEASFIGTIEDISYHYEFYQKMLQIEKMRALGVMAGGIAHEINNQLMVVSGSIDLLRNTHRINNHHLEFMSQAISKSKEIVKSLITFAQQDKITFESMNLSECVEEIIALQQKIYSDFQIRYHSTNDELFIYGNLSLVNNAIINMLINSIKSTKNQVEVKLEKVYLEEKPLNLQSQFNFVKGNYAKLSFYDNGNPIEDIDRDKIFEPFYFMKNLTNGTGMELSVVLGTMLQHQGLITVESAKFYNVYTLYFKLDKSMEKFNLDFREQPKRILVVDDDKMVLMILEEILKSLNYEVVAFNRAIEALEYYQNNYLSIDLILSDMLMPEMNGKEFYLECKKIYKLTKFIILSGFTNDKETIDGVLEYLSKPIDMEKMKIKIAEVLNNQNT